MVGVIVLLIDASDVDVVFNVEEAAGEAREVRLAVFEALLILEAVGEVQFQSCHIVEGVIVQGPVWVMFIQNGGEGGLVGISPTVSLAADVVVMLFVDADAGLSVVVLALDAVALLEVDPTEEVVDDGELSVVVPVLDAVALVIEDEPNSADEVVDDVELPPKELVSDTRG